MQQRQWPTRMSARLLLVMIVSLLLAVSMAAPAQAGASGSPSEPLTRLMRPDPLGLESAEGTRSLARAINAAGTIVGFSRHEDGEDRAVRWSTESDTVTELPMRPEWTSSTAEAINNRGFIVGSREIPGSPDGRFRAVVWSPDGQITELDPLPDGLPGSTAYGINDDGFVVGTADFSPPPRSESRAVMWSPDGEITNLGKLGGDPYESFLFAEDINATGTVVGQSLGLQSPRPFRWTAENGMAPLRPLDGGCCGAGEAINDNGYAAGYTNNESSEGHAVRWQPNGTPVDLGVLPGGDQSHGIGVNENGDVSGWSETDSGDLHAALWPLDGGVTDLGTLEGFEESAAHDINETEDVVGVSMRAGRSRSRAVRWDPDGRISALCELTDPCAQQNRQ